MKDWIKQRTTLLGIGAAIIAILGTFDAPWAGTAAQITSAVLSAIGLALPDKGKIKATGGEMLSVLLACAISANALGCASSLSDLPISDDRKVAIAIEAGCAAAASAGCLADEDVTDLLGKLKTSAECVAAVTQIIESRSITIDITTLTGKRFSCNRFVKSFVPTSATFQVTDSTSVDSLAGN